MYSSCTNNTLKVSEKLKIKTRDDVKCLKRDPGTAMNVSLDPTAEHYSAGGGKPVSSPCRYTESQAHLPSPHLRRTAENVFVVLCYKQNRQGASLKDTHSAEQVLMESCLL